MNEILITFDDASFKRKVVKRDIVNWMESIFKELRIKDKTCSVLFTDYENIKKLNAEYRHKDYVTDVLSFSQMEGLAVSGNAALGDIVICMPQAAEQAEKMRHSLESEINFLLLHGILHLLGNDHEKDDGEMNRLEKKIYKKLTGVDLVDA